MIEAGIYQDLSSEDYHNDKQSISRSAICDFRRNPRMYWAKHLNPDRPIEEQKPSWTFGTAFHTLIIESHLFEESYIIMPEEVLKRDDPEKFEILKQAKKEAEQSTKAVLSQKEFVCLCAMRDSLGGNIRAKELIDSAVYESSYFWKDEESGLMVKSRPDILHPRIYVDLKTIDDASPHNFQNEMAKYGYHIQAAMLCDGIVANGGERPLACINVCVEKKYPYNIGIYIIDESALEVGREEYKQILLDMATCLRDNVFMDFEPQTVSLPKWYQY